MASATLSNHVLQLVVWSSLTMLVLTLLLLLQILLLRIRLIASTAREQRFLAVWRPLLAATIAGEAVALPPLAKGEEMFFLKLWNHMQESLRGDAKARLNALADRCGILPHVHALLGKNGLRPRLVALITLGHLGDRSAWIDILRLSREPDSLLSLAAARALFQIDTAAALNDLMPQLLQREDWPTAQLTILFEESGTDSMFAELSGAAASLSNQTGPADVARLKRLLRLLEIAPPQHTMQAVRAVLPKATDDEIVAECLKFLHEPGDLAAVRSHLNHPNWVVRLQAARALGRFGAAEDMPRLARLLGDSVWWVRYRSAQALMALTHGDVQALTELRTNLTDRYALDMLEMVMTEREGR